MSSDGVVEKRAREDFRVFVYLIWKFLKLPDPTPLQYELAHYLQDTSQRRKLIMAFRGMGKSYLTSAYVLWRLYRNCDENILVVSASKDRSDAFSRFTKMLVGEMPLLQHMTPRQGHGFDSIERFTVGNAMVSQSPSVKSLGLYGQLTGSRASIIIADDVETPNNSESQTQRDKLVERTKEFSAILKPDDDGDGSHNQIIYLGTPQTEDSIYNKLPHRGRHRLIQKTFRRYTKAAERIIEQYPQYRKHKQTVALLQKGLDREGALPPDIMTLLDQQRRDLEAIADP